MELKEEDIKSFIDKLTKLQEKFEAEKRAAEKAHKKYLKIRAEGIVQGIKLSKEIFRKYFCFYD